MSLDVNPVTTVDREAAAAAWSPAQLVRIESEWRRLRRGFAFHPTIKVTPTAGEPPCEYRIEYRLRTLIVDGAGELAYVDTVPVTLSLPPQFPHAAPTLRPGVAIFHPNISGDHIHLSPPWHAGAGSLVDVIVRCGQMLAYQFYDPIVIYNVAAMQWVGQYAHLIPTDPNADFSLEAGGGALERIAHEGAELLERLMSQLTERSLSILEGGPGTSPEDVRQFGEQTSAALSVFADPDIPDDIKARAADLDAWAQSMTPSRSLWDDLRAVGVSTRAASAAAQRVKPTQEALDSAIRAVEGLGAKLTRIERAEDDPFAAVAALPGVAELDALSIRLRGAIRAAEPTVTSLRSAVEDISGAPLAPAGTPGSLLFDRTSADTTRANADAAAARQTNIAILATIEPALTRARAEQAALDALVAWAGFADLMRRGNEMTQRLIDLGGGGIQAYFVQSAGGRYGPYQLEERLDLSGALLVVRRIGAGPIEVYDARTMAMLAKGQGRVRVSVIGDDGSTATETDIRATEHTDELRVQLDYLIKTSREQIAQLGNAAGSTAAPSWAGRLSGSLAKFASTHAATEMHRRASHRWTALLADLDAVGPFKERLATWHLVERHAEFVPAVMQVRDKARAALDEASERLAFVAARSTRDADRGTERMVVPPQYGQEYVDRVKQRTKAEKDLAKVRKLLGLVATELETRLASEVLQGKAGTPPLRLLAMAQDTPENVDELLSDQHLQSRLSELDVLLGTHLASRLASTGASDSAP